MDFSALFTKLFGRKGGNPVQTILEELHVLQQKLESAAVRIGFIGGQMSTKIIKCLGSRPALCMQTRIDNRAHRAAPVL